MKRFHFPLEIVRRWRLERVGIEELKLQQILAEKQNLALTRAGIQAEINRTVEQLLRQPSMQPFELESLDSFRVHGRGRIRDLETEERRCESRVVEQRNQVLEARRQFELLDRLRQKAFTEWTAAGNQEQEETVAELFLAKSARERKRNHPACAAELRADQ